MSFCAVESGFLITFPCGVYRSPIRLLPARMCHNYRNCHSDCMLETLSLEFIEIYISRCAFK